MTSKPEFSGELKTVKCAFCGDPVQVPIEVNYDAICGRPDCYAPEGYFDG